MNLKDLQAQIKSNQLDDIYIFTGEEIRVQKLYINKIAEVKEMNIIYVDYYKDIVLKLHSNNLFDMKCIYVVLYDEDILKHEEAWKDINANGNIIIFKYVGLDKRSRFYKHFEQRIVEFNKLSKEVLSQYIKVELPLSDANCMKLIDICDNSYSQILLELDKIKNYKADVPMSANNIFEVLYTKGAFHSELEDVTFEFIDAMIMRDVIEVRRLVNDARANDINVLGFLSLLYTNFRAVLLIQSCKSSDIVKTTGLTPQQVYYNKDKVGKYSISELIYTLKTIYKLDKAVKEGTIEESFVLDYLLVNLL